MGRSDVGMPIGKRIGSVTENLTDGENRCVGHAALNGQGLIRGQNQRPSLRARLAYFKEVAKQMVQKKEKNREKGEMER